MGNAGSSLFFLVIIAVPVLLIMFQRRTLRRQTETTQSLLEPGAEVMTGGGLYAFVHDVDGDVVELETSPGIITRWDRRAIAKVITPDPDEFGDESDDVEVDAYAESDQPERLADDDPALHGDDEPGETRGSSRT